MQATTRSFTASLLVVLVDVETHRPSSVTTVITPTSTVFLLVVIVDITTSLILIKRIMTAVTAVKTRELLDHEATRDLTGRSLLHSHKDLMTTLPRHNRQLSRLR